MQRKAVFARNHAKYLDAASIVASSFPSQPITFRSTRRWVSAMAALDEQKTMDVYLSPIGSKGTVGYRATLRAIVLDPAPGDLATEAWMKRGLPETAAEGLWNTGAEGDTVKTLYVLSHCQRLAQPFPQSKLRKASDGMPVSDAFGYSYAVVLEPEDDADPEGHPEEVTAQAQYPEGGVKRVTVNAYERNPAAREAAVRHHGVACKACGFNFETRYGEIGAGFIHVHHVKPLADIKAGYQVNPATDLVPVCPNCHAMLHRGASPPTVTELALKVRKLAQPS